MLKTGGRAARRLLLIAAVATLAAATLPAAPALAQGMGAGGGGDAGQKVFKSANCVGCHHWTGTGGGSYGGASANLRATQLTPEQIAEVVRCGRPSTGMPFFERNAYSDGRCYGGLRAADLPPDQLPPEPDHYLRAPEIEAVTGYVIANLKGRGEPTFAECQAFFGTQTRACNIYKPKEGAVDAAARPPSP